VLRGSAFAAAVVSHGCLHAYRYSSCFLAGGAVAVARDIEGADKRGT